MSGNVSAIETAWQNYRLLVLPADASEVQVTECRRAFFGGAAVLFSALMSNEHSEAEYIAMMTRLARELDQYGQELDAHSIDTKGLQS